MTTYASRLKDEAFDIPGISPTRPMGWTTEPEFASRAGDLPELVSGTAENTSDPCVTSVTVEDPYAEEAAEPLTELNIWCAENNCGKSSCHRCHPRAGCSAHEECRELTEELEASGVRLGGLDFATGPVDWLEDNGTLFFKVALETGEEVEVQYVRDGGVETLTFVGPVNAVGHFDHYVENTRRAKFATVSEYAANRAQWQRGRSDGALKAQATRHARKQPPTLEEEVSDRGIVEQAVQDLQSWKAPPRADVAGAGMTDMALPKTGLIGLKPTPAPTTENYESIFLDGFLSVLEIKTLAEARAQAEIAMQAFSRLSREVLVVSQDTEKHRLQTLCRAASAYMRTLEARIETLIETERAVVPLLQEEADVLSGWVKMLED